MNFVYLVISIIAELFATSYLRETKGFTNLGPSLICGIAYVVCHYTFSKAILSLNLGVAYALWCGIGILVTTIVSYSIYREHVSWPSLSGVALIFLGTILVNLGGY